jgi:CubicO group peptidase (beta-lactamase class C family)
MRSSALIIAAALLAGACTSDTDSPAADDAPEEEAIACDAATHDALTAWERAGFSGSVAMTTDGEPTCLAGYGLADEATGRPNTADTVFAIGSVSKAMTAAAVLGLVDEGLLALDDRAGDLVPGLDGPVSDAEVEDLLLHTSGLAGSHGTDHEPLDREAAVAALGGLEVVTEPGTTFGYSNAGYTLLALIVEEVSGTDYRDHLVDQVLRDGEGVPLGGFWDGEPAAAVGPRAVGYRDDGEPGEAGDFAGPHWALAGNGDLAMTMPELATWTRALMTGELLSAESTALLSELQADAGDGAMVTPGWGVLDPAVLGEPALGSAGGGGDVGHDVAVVWLPTSERVVAIGSNRPEITAEDLLQTIGPSLVAGDPLPAPTPEQDVDPAELAALEGRYQLPSDDEIDVRVVGQQLQVTPSGPDALAAILPLPEGVDRSEAEAHEADVLAALGGETAAGREEVELLEDDLGPITSVELVGTIVADRELRTFVEIVADGSTTLAWYALDERGDIAAVDLGGDPPSLTVAPIGPGRFRPADPTASAVDVAVTFEGDIMSITGPTGTVQATRR